MCFKCAFLFAFILHQQVLVVLKCIHSILFGLWVLRLFHYLFQFVHFFRVEIYIVERKAFALEVFEINHLFVLGFAMQLIFQIRSLRDQLFDVPPFTRPAVDVRSILVLFEPVTQVIVLFWELALVQESVSLHDWVSSRVIQYTIEVWHLLLECRHILLESLCVKSDFGEVYTTVVIYQLINIRQD